jgi:hypothetical protein
MPKVLGWGRLQAVRRLVVMAVSAKLLQEVARHPGLKVVSIHTNLSRVAPDLLARVVTGLEEVEMWGTPPTQPSQLTQQQVEVILTAITSADSRLKKLNIGGNQLYNVAPDLLARAVPRLEELEMKARVRDWMRYDGLTQQQVEGILTAITSGDSRLKKLNMSHNNLSNVAPDLLARAVTRQGRSSARACWIYELA